jgi:hypothetical protein
MTRLTNELRRHIIAKIMAQVPKIDYHQSTKEFLNEAARAIAPPEIMALHGTPVWTYVSVQRVYVANEGTHTVCPLPSSNDDRLHPHNPDPHWRKLWDAYAASGLRGKAEEQEKARRSMEAKLLQVMQSTSTLKGLRNVMSPDLHQFVPVDVEVKANLPIPAIAAELKAMGMQLPDTDTTTS